jgi:hypothetical protein
MSRLPVDCDFDAAIFFSLNLSVQERDLSVVFLLRCEFYPWVLVVEMNLVVMDRKEYEDKMNEKLKDITTYKPIKNDPTESIKEDIAKQLNDMMKAGQIENSLRLKLSPTQSQIPRMYGQVKIHKEGYPLREIVDANGGATKPIDGYIAKIMKRYVGQTVRHIKNFKYFTKKIKKL